MIFDKMSNPVFRPLSLTNAARCSGCILIQGSNSPIPNSVPKTWITIAIKFAWLLLCACCYLDTSYAAAADIHLLWDSLDRKGLELTRHSKFEEAKNYFNRALAIAEEEDGKGSELSAATNHHLGLLYKKAGDSKQSLQYLLKALDIEEHSSWNTNPRVSAVLDTILTIYWRRLDYDAVERFTEKQLSFLEGTVGKDSSIWCVQMFHAANLEIEFAIVIPAEAHLKALKGARHCTSENRIRLHQNLCKLISRLLKSKDRYGHRLIAQDIGLVEDLDGQDSENLIKPMLQYGQALLNFPGSDEWEQFNPQAEVYCKRARQIASAKFGNNSPQVAESDRILAKLQERAAHAKKSANH